MDLFVHCPSGNDNVESGIRRHFLGFEDGFTLFEEAYPTVQHQLVRSAGPGAYHDAPLFDRRQREHSRIYQEVFRPVRIDRQMALSVPLPQGEAMLLTGFAFDAVPAYSGRRHQLLQLLVPAFEAGLRFRHRITSLKAGLDRTIDVLPVPLLVFDADGAERYRNAAFGALAQHEPQSERLVAAARKLARRLAPGIDAEDSLLPSLQVATEKTAHAGRYTLRGYYDPRLFVDGGLLVSVERSALVPSPDFIATASGLTPRQAEVAVLVAEGLSDQEVADCLCISVHTVRRHAAAVRKKLGVPSRAGVATALARLVRSGPRS